MVFGHSWSQRRLHRKISGQMKRRGHKSKFKRVLLIALTLFGLYLLYTNFTEANSSNPLNTPSEAIPLSQLQ